MDYYLTFYFLSLCLISMAYMLQTASQTLELKLFWANIKVIGICLMPGTWLLVSSLVTLRRLPPKKIQWLVWLGAAVNIIIVYTDSFHQLYRKSIVLEPVSETLSLMKSSFGEWYFTGYLYYVYGLTLISLIYYVSAIIISAKLKKIQYSFHIVAIVIGALGGIPFIIGKVQLDTYSTTIIFTALIHYFLIYKFGFLNVIQMAKEVVVDKIDTGIFIFASDGKLVEKNAKAVEILPKVLTIDEFCKYFEFDCAESINGKQVIRDVIIHGTARRMKINLMEVTEPDKEVSGYLADISDVTEYMHLMQLEAEKEKLHQKKLIIGDIHDGIGSAVSMVSLLAGQEYQSESELLKNINQIQAIALETSREVRLMMNSYDRENPEFNELCGDLRHVGNLFTGGTGIRFSLEEKKSVDIPVHISFSAYINLIRFFKECIVNIVKHAQADKTVAKLETDGCLLTIRIQDNGLGYESGQEHCRGRGLKNMKQRIENIDGSLYIKEAGGTVVKVILPVSEQ